jgi:hypothetical protein
MYLALVINETVFLCGLTFPEFVSITCVDHRDTSLSDISIFSFLQHILGAQ